MNSSHIISQGFKNSKPLNDEDKVFIKGIADNYNLDPIKLEVYLKSIKDKINDILPFLPIKHDDYLEYFNRRMIKKEIKEILIKIFFEWDIPKFKKYIVTALILIHYKLDKYYKILSKQEYYRRDYSSQDYNHYLYDSMKSRFKSINKNKKANKCLFQENPRMEIIDLMLKMKAENQ